MRYPVALWMTLLGPWLLLPAEALACACCVEPGLWHTSSSPLDEPELNLLNQLAFEDAVLVRDIGQADSVTTWEEGRVWGSFEDNTLVLRFNPEASTDEAVLHFTPGGEVEIFATDRSSSASTLGDTVVPYQELRLEGTLGSEHPAVLPVAEDLPATLVLQGNGSQCLDSRNFDHWILKFSTREGSTVEAAHAYGGLSSAGHDSVASRVEVFKESEGRQCETDSGIALDDMQNELSDAGIGVLTSACGAMTGVQFITACGAYDGGINVYTIPAADLEQALSLGFRETAALPGDGWSAQPCNSQTGD